MVVDDKDCGNFFNKLTSILITTDNKNGRLYLDLGFGFKDFCVFIRLKNFHAWDDVLPQMFTCKKLNFLNDLSSEARQKIWKNNDQEKRLFDESIDSKKKNFIS